MDSSAIRLSKRVDLHFEPEVHPNERGVVVVPTVGIWKAHENAGRHAERDATILRLKTLEDPPERTLEVMRRNGWLAKGA